MREDKEFESLSVSEIIKKLKAAKRQYGDVTLNYVKSLVAQEILKLRNENEQLKKDLGQTVIDYDVKLYNKDCEN